MKKYALYLKNPKFTLSLIVIIILIFIGIMGPYMAPNDPLEMNTTYTLKKGSDEFPLGTDEYGRCIYSRILVGLRPSLIVALTGTFFAFAGGSILGIIAGYFGKKLDHIIMRGMDVILSFPPILLAMMVVGMLGDGIRNLIIIIAVLYLPHFTRIAYSSTLNIVKMEYVESEVSIGSSKFRIITKSIFPNILSSLVIQVSLTVSNAILLESGLSFLGLGVRPPAPSWGQMIGAARSFITVHPSYMLWPAFILSITILSMNMMGDSLRDILDPKLRDSL